MSIGNYSNPTMFSNAVEEGIHNRCLILPTQRAKEHFFVVTQFDSAFQQKVSVPNGYYNPESLAAVVNASLSGITLSLQINDQTMTMRYTFSSDDNFPFSIDFSPSDTLARTFGFYQRRHHGMAVYTSFEDIPVAFVYNDHPCLDNDVAGRVRRYPRGIYSVTGTVPNKNHFMVLTDTGNSWNVPNKEQTNNMYNNVDGEGLLTIFTKNISTQQSYNFQKGDVVRITGYNEDSVELKVQSGFVDETSGEGVEQVRLPVLGGSGYVYPPKVYYEGTRMVAPIIPILLDGKVVAFDMPNRARIVSLEQNTLTLSGSGLWFENDQATIRVHDGGAEFVVRNVGPNLYHARHHRTQQTLHLPSNHGLPPLSHRATCEIVANRPAPVNNRLSVQPPGTSMVEHMDVHFRSNPCKVVYTLTLNTPLQLPPQHATQAVVWTATEQAYLVKRVEGNVLVMEADHWPGKQSEPDINDELGHVYAAVSMPVPMNKIYNKGGIYTGDMVLGGFDASTINCMKENIRLYHSFSCNRSEVVAVTEVKNNNELYLSKKIESLPDTFYIALCGTKEHDGVWQVKLVNIAGLRHTGEDDGPNDSPNDSLNDSPNDSPNVTILKLQNATGSVTLDHLPTVMLGCTGTYNFNEQTILYQDMDAGEIFYQPNPTNEEQPLHYETAKNATESESARPLFRRAKNHQDSVDVQANTDIGALGFLVYVPPLEAAHGVLDEASQTAYPALAGFLSNEGATPPVVFSGGTLLNESNATPAHATTSMMHGSIVSSKFFYNGARVEVSNDRMFRIVAAYVPRTDAN